MRTKGATRRLDLRTGTTVWSPSAAGQTAATPLDEDISVDVAVIGCGISGALAADAVLRAGQTVAGFDRRGIAVGSTAASTALLQFEIDQPLTTLTSRIGRDKAMRAYARSAGAVTYLQARIRDLGLRCFFRERHTAYLPGDLLDADGLRREAEARDRAGLRSRFIDADELRALTGVTRDGAIWSGGSGEVDPVALVRGLWRSAVRRGARIHAPCDIADIAPGPTSVVLTTDGGQTVRAKRVVLASGYELAKIVRLRGYKIISTWAMATAPQPDRLWPSRCLIWEAADPYLYLRTTSDGRVIAGGEDEEFRDEAHRDRLLPQKIKRISAKLKALMPGLDVRPDYGWAGSFGESATGLPAIGWVDGSERCFAVAGYGGNGITYSVIAAQILQRNLLGLRDPDQDVFAFS